MPKYAMSLAKLLSDFNMYFEMSINIYNMKDTYTVMTNLTRLFVLIYAQCNGGMNSLYFP